MLFQASITIPKNTTYDSPTIAMFKIAHGIVTKIMVRPRPGHAALAHLVILHHEHQIAPSTENMDLHGDAPAIDWEEYYESYQPPYELKLKGWNEDDTYDHTITLMLLVLPKSYILPVGAVEGIMESLSNLIIRKGDEE